MADGNTCFFAPVWPLLYLDNHLLALYKPAGLLVQGDRTDDASLLELGKLWLKHRFQKPGRVFLGMVHRLDRPVAGVVVFGRTSKAAARLSEQFRLGSVIKRYLAVVEGRLEREAAQLVNFLERDDMNSKVSPHASPHSQVAKLSYQVLDAIRSRSLIEVQLETGRRHQIRVQLAHIGHPVVGDVRYGASAALPKRQIALFAKQLIIKHPTRAEEVSISCALPADWPWKAAVKIERSPLWNWEDLQPLVENSQGLAPGAINKGLFNR
jgi:23S rRNA pseudouridine1911/1915/1917 synthase